MSLLIEFVSLLNYNSFHFELAFFSVTQHTQMKLVIPVHMGTQHQSHLNKQWDTIYQLIMLIVRPPMNHEVP